MNSSLYDRKAVVPDTLLKHLQKCFDSTSTSENDEGGKRNKELRDSKVASYQQIKRIKNWFDSYSGNKEDAPFILNGGDRMKGWCDEVLRVWRQGDNSGKKIKMNTGMENQYLDSHEKNNFNLNNKHTSSVDNLKVNEEVKKINKLINKIL